MGIDIVFINNNSQTESFCIKWLYLIDPNIINESLDNLILFCNEQISLLKNKVDIISKIANINKSYDFKNYDEYYNRPEELDDIYHMNLKIKKEFIIKLINSCDTFYMIEEILELLNDNNLDEYLDSIINQLNNFDYLNKFLERNKKNKYVISY